MQQGYFYYLQHNALSHGAALDQTSTAEAAVEETCCPSIQRLNVQTEDCGSDSSRVPACQQPGHQLVYSEVGNVSTCKYLLLCTSGRCEGSGLVEASLFLFLLGFLRGHSVIRLLHALACRAFYTNLNNTFASPTALSNKCNAQGKGQ